MNAFSDDYRPENRIAQFFEFPTNEEIPSSKVIKENFFGPHADSSNGIVLDIRGRIKIFDDEIRKKCRRAIELYGSTGELQLILEEQKSCRDQAIVCSRDPEDDPQYCELNFQIMVCLNEIPGFKHAVEELVETRARFKRENRRAKHKLQ